MSNSRLDSDSKVGGDDGMEESLSREDRSSVRGSGLATITDEAVVGIVISVPEEVATLKARSPKSIGMGLVISQDDKLPDASPKKKSFLRSESYSEECRKIIGFGELSQFLEVPLWYRKNGKGPLWVAFCILIGGLLLDVLISISLGVSALPANIIIGVLIMLGLGTALRLSLECCHGWSLRRNAPAPADTVANPPPRSLEV
ncbi:unnamed protein product [Spirodela intermedia]|uniref:Uncharacterized protein n=1 Tax=Spirodela intermedia TaxID=51605 RepID=A0A7I8JA01_SPIIN|nr:unnamed protein product [Spirodela intermedia]CAA6666924.1 unnamed protein product [Spirodela intermedia]